MSDIAGQMTVYQTPDGLADGVAEWLADLASMKDGDFTVCLSGGSTPRRLYERLARSPFREDFPWARTHWFFGDERFVPPDSPDSNLGMARKALLSRVPIPPDNIHAIDTTQPAPEDAAEDYDRRLRSYYGSSSLDPRRPLFDVNFLGLGPDGHTASLLPSEPVLDETHKWAATVAHGRPEVRVTLTYPVLASSSYIAFLVTGIEKASILRQVRAGGSQMPAARLESQGDIRWFVDRAASGD